MNFMFVKTTTACFAFVGSSGGIDTLGGIDMRLRYSIPSEEPTKAKQAVVVFTFCSDFIQINSSS